MNRNLAVTSLMSERQDERLRSARFFSSAATPSDLTLLTRALQTENVPWIRRAIERAIWRAENHFTVPLPENWQETTEIKDVESEDFSRKLLRTLRAEAVDEVSRTILHEFSPLVGSLRLTAPLEVSNYEQSRTRQLVEQFGALLAAVRNLKQAASTPNYSEFDLAELVSECVSVIVIDDKNFSIRFAGIQPYMVHADRESLSLAISNGIRNAVEAVVEFSSTELAEVLINWGPAGAENWLAILDTGPGFAAEPSDALKLGNSTKKNHFGYGLTIAQLAMRAMDGDLYISNKSEGGARFELRWYKENAHIVR